MSANELIQRRAAMMQSRSGGIDWENIARGMLERTINFDIPSSIEVTPYDYLFYKRTGLNSITIASNATSIPINMFSGCSGLRTITIPSSVTSIGQTAFTGTGLQSLTIPSSVTSIGVQAFSACSSLVEVIMEATTPPTLGSNAFIASNNLASIYVPDASVDTYKGASGWSTYASLIKPISQRP